MRFLFAAALSLVLVSGCAGSSSGVQSRAELEQQIKQQIEEEMRVRHIEGSIKEVSLVEDGPNTFTGFATDSFNQQTKLTVTVGKDGKAIYETDPIQNPNLANGH